MRNKTLPFFLLLTIFALSLSACGGDVSVMPGGSSTFASVAPTHADLAYASVSDT